MQKLLLSLCLIFLFIGKTSAESLDTDKLIKVTSDTDPSCVEYYYTKDGLYCSTKAQSSQSIDLKKIKEYEKLNVVFDDRPWKLAWGNLDEAGPVVEYTTNNEEVEHWTELVTSRFFPNGQEKASPKEYALSLIEGFKDAGFKPLVTWHEETADRVIFEMQLDEPKNQIQDLLVMYLKDDKGIYNLQYVIRKEDVGEEARDKWIQNFKKVTIQKDE